MTLLPRDLDVDEVAQLRLERAETARRTPAKPRRIAGAQADPLARARIDAVVQRDLEHLGQVEVAGEDVGLLAERAHFHAAARAAQRAHPPRTCPAAPVPATIRSALKIDGWPKPVRMISRGALDEAVGVLLADLDVETGLQQAHLFDHVEQQVGDLVDAVRAIGLQAADVDLREVGVGAALGRGHAHLGRRGLVVELDPEALQQLLGLTRASACRRPGPRW